MQSQSSDNDSNVACLWKNSVCPPHRNDMKLNHISDATNGHSSSGDDVTHINDLPDDIFFLIFEYLKPSELWCVACVNRRLRHLSCKDSVWLLHARQRVLVQPLEGLLNGGCGLRELCRRAPNWIKRNFKEGFSAKHKNRLIPWLCKDGKDLWFSSANTIRCFQTRSKGFPTEQRNRNPDGLKDDITKFTVKNNRIVSGTRNGDILCWDTMGNLLFNYKGIHSSDSQCVDFTDRIIISGSRDATCKAIYYTEHRENSTDGFAFQTFDAAERVWSLKISPNERMFAAGLTGDFYPVTMWDIESGQCLGNLGDHLRRGSGVFDMMFESPHDLITCGYDTFIRLWDLRSHTCVQQWEEPYDSALYCMASDGNNALAVGTARHGMVRLWDRRQSNPVMAYYSHHAQSPVYGLAMDEGHLYLALDKGLNVMDFTV